MCIINSVNLGMCKNVLQILLLKNLPCHFTNVLKKDVILKEHRIETIKRDIKKLVIRFDIIYYKMKWKKKKIVIVTLSGR